MALWKCDLAFMKRGCSQVVNSSLRQVQANVQSLSLGFTNTSHRCFRNHARHQQLDSARKPGFPFEPPREPIQAASELDPTKFSAVSQLAEHARPVPESPSYFSRATQFNDSFVKLQKLQENYSNLPTLPTGQAERVAWKSLTDYRLSVGERVKATHYARCLEIIKQLHRIHPDIKPVSITAALSSFRKDIQGYRAAPKPVTVDKFGRALGVGKRKSSTARAWVVEGTGEVLINGKSLADYFCRVHDRESAMWALYSTSRLDKYNVWALTEGGGTTGQAEALTLAVAKALMAHEPALKAALRRAGCVTRDPRSVERKKHGHVKARKSPTWVKR